MDQYRRVSSEVSRLLTKRYSTSFSTASMLFGKNIKPHIYNIYGLVRIADEIVDTYSGKDALNILDDFEKEVADSLTRGYSTNPVVQAFVDTATTYGIGKELISPFFKSMRTDTSKKTYSKKEYIEYIYGSAEVVGLMCLKVFCSGNKEEYENLEPGASALGSAFQKVNFLRDLASDQKNLGRYYFPVGSYQNFDDVLKQEIVEDIEQDFNIAIGAINHLPSSSRIAVTVAYRYYRALLSKLKATPAKKLKSERIRVSDINKLGILIQTLFYQTISRKAL